MMAKSFKSGFKLAARAVFAALAGLAVFAAGQAVIAAGIASPSDAQTSTTNVFLDTAVTLNFRLQVNGGVEPLLTINPRSDSFCFAPEGGVVRRTTSININVNTHQETRNFVCRHIIFINFHGFNSCTASVVKRGQDTDLSVSTSSASGVRRLIVEGSGIPNFNTGVGRLKAIDENDNDIAGGDNLSDLDVRVDDCEAQAAGSTDGFFVLNPEPGQSMRAFLQGVNNCGSEQEENLDERVSSLGRVFMRPNTDCNWNFFFEDAMTACTALAAIYLQGLNNPEHIATRRGSEQSLRLSGAPGGSANTQGRITFGGTNVIAIYIYRSQSCVEVIVANISVNVPQGLEDLPVNIEVVPERGTRSGLGCTSLSGTATGNEPATFFLRRRDSGTGALCRYVVRPQRVAGALELDPTEQTQQELELSGGRYVARLDYLNTQIPIQLHTVFPSQVFTTNDRVEFGISSPGACGVITNTLGALGARIGVHREFPAHPGTTQLLGLRATTVGSEPPYIYTMPPTLRVRDRFGRATETDCTVSVQLVRYPRNCMPVGETTQNVTANSDSEAYDFFFIFECDGERGVQTTPGEPPAPPSPDDDRSTTVPAETVLRIQPGWKTFYYNGNPVVASDFIADTPEIEGIWIWDAVGQSWQGYARNGRANSLEMLNTGQVFFMYVNSEVNLILRPGNLLSVASSSSDVVLLPRYNLIAYDGPERSVATAFSSPNVRLIYMWDNDDQDWKFYEPGNTTSSTLNNVRRGDLLFVYSGASETIRISS